MSTGGKTTRCTGGGVRWAGPRPTPDPSAGPAPAYLAVERPRRPAAPRTVVAPKWDTAAGGWSRGTAGRGTGGAPLLSLEGGFAGAAGKSRRKRACPQQIVTTRLLYCLQGPFAQLSRLQRIRSRARQNCNTRITAGRFGPCGGIACWDTGPEPILIRL